MEKMERVRSVTRHYNALRGLLLVPAGLYMIMAALWHMKFHSLLFPGGGNDWTTSLFILLIFSSIVGLTLLITRYYRRRFGQVEPTPEEEQRMRLVPLVWMAIYCGGSYLDLSYHPPVSFFCLFLAAGLLLYWRSMDRLPRHYLGLAITIAVIGLLPLFNPVRNLLFLHGFTSYIEEFVYPLAGSIAIIAGIGNHLLLQRSMHTFNRI